MAILNINFIQLQMVFLVFVRLSAILMSIPIFGSHNIPFVVKAGMALSAAIVLYPILNLQEISSHLAVVPFIIGICTEILLGLIIGLSVNLMFSGIQLAGQLVGYQMGFAIANVMDPQTGSQASIMAIFLNITAMLLFLVFNGHHWFLQSITDSFDLVPVFHFKVSGPLIQHLIRLGGNMFVIAVKVAAPIMAALLLASVCLGLIARTVPRMNVFLVGMPLKIGVGLLFCGISLPYLSSFLGRIFGGLGQDIIHILKLV